MRRCWFVCALALAACPRGFPDPLSDAGVASDGGHALPRPGFAAAWQVHDPAELIAGPSTAGKVLDWEIANARVRFVIEGAHASDGYDPYGCSVLAADRQRAAGEPGESRFGEMWIGLNFRAPDCSALTLVNDGRDGEPAQLHAEGHDAESPFMASIFALSSQPAPLHATVYRDYFLAPDADALQLNLVVRNDGAEDLFLNAPYVGMAMNRGLRHWVDHSGFDFDFNDLANVNPQAEFYAAVGERVSYSIYNIEAPFSPILNFAHVLIGQYPQVHIPPGQAHTWRFLIGVGTGDTGSLQLAHAQARGAQSTLVSLSGTVVDAAGAPVPRARVHVTTSAGDQAIAFARTDEGGGWTAPVRAGNYALRPVADDRLAGPLIPVAVPAAGLVGLQLQLGAASAIDAAATDAALLGLPAKIVLEPRQPLRPQLPAPLGEPSASAPVVVFAADGHARVPVSAGSWAVTFSRGFEYDLTRVEVSAPAGGVALARATLNRVVDTTGWMSGDFHVHAQFSPDGDDLLAEKVRAFAAEGVEVPVSTEHEFIGDFGPTVRALGLAGFMHAVPGTELTTTASGHFNIFPLTPRPDLLNHGGLSWYNQAIPTVLDQARGRLTPDGAVPLVQMNHPRSIGMAYLDAVRFDPNSFTAQASPADWSDRWDAMEVWNGVELSRFEGCPTQAAGCSAPAHPTAFDWFAFLDRRKPITATGNSDSHKASLREVGYPRNYLYVGSDDPAGLTDAALLAAVRAQRVVISGGPFLVTSVGKVLPGGTARSDASSGSPVVHLHLEIQAPRWMGPLSQVDVWVGDKSPNGGHVARSFALADDASKVLRYSGTVDIPVAQDTWLIATVRGPVDASGFSHALWPVVEQPLPPFAITNPIWIDFDGDGVVTPLRP